MYGLSPVATSSKVLEYQEKLGFFQPKKGYWLAAEDWEQYKEVMGEDL